MPFLRATDGTKIYYFEGDKASLAAAQKKLADHNRELQEMQRRRMTEVAKLRKITPKIKFFPDKKVLKKLNPKRVPKLRRHGPR